MADTPSYSSGKTTPATVASKRSAVRNSASTALETTGTTVRSAADKAVASIEANPLSALVGGLAIGALAGSLVPRTAQEANLLAPVGKRLSETARGAVDAAKQTAKSEFDVLGLSRDAARGQVSRVLEGVLKAVSTAGVAALAAANDKAAAKKATVTE
ncbi:hypothetical protein U1872_05625 [Sphingomonas sp. RB3P16]|uniref:hypothetical protein n=1 Tax=Parasphingomonas frigoris TaxID=3096163 RepID=UPI002FCC2BD5